MSIANYKCLITSTHIHIYYTLAYMLTRMFQDPQVMALISLTDSAYLQIWTRYVHVLEKLVAPLEDEYEQQWRYCLLKCLGHSDGGTQLS